MNRPKRSTRHGQIAQNSDAWKKVRGGKTSSGDVVGSRACGIKRSKLQRCHERSIAVSASRGRAGCKKTRWKLDHRRKDGARRKLSSLFLSFLWSRDGVHTCIRWLGAKTWQTVGRITWHGSRATCYRRKSSRLWWE